MVNNPNKLIFVVGMHRSLTSFTASTLAKAFGGFIAEKKALLCGVAGNRPGHFESKHVFRLNDLILKDNDLTWRTVRQQPRVSNEDRRQIADVIKDDFASRPVSIIKDPRLCYMIPYWYNAACQYYDPKNIFVVYVIRHPLQVAQSLKNMRDMPLAEALDLWTFHNAQALYFLQRFDSLGDDERSARWCAIDTSDAEMRHFSDVIKRVQKGIGFGKLADSHPLRTYRPAEKHFSSVPPEGETIPDSDDLRIAIETYCDLLALAKASGPITRIEDLKSIREG